MRVISSYLPLAATFCFGISAHLAHANIYTVISTSTDAAFTSPLTKTDTVVQEGSDSRNRFVMHRVVKSSSSHKGTIILLPALVTNFKLYTLDESQNAMLSLAAKLANANYDVYGYSPRTSLIPAGACSGNQVDCSIMSTWGIATYVADIDYITQQAVAAHPGEKPAIGGLSLGGMLGVATVNANPNSYSGLLTWESMLYSANAAITTLNTANCAQDNATLAAGTAYSENLSNAAKSAVNSGESVAVAFLGTPNPVFGTPTFITATPATVPTQFKYSLFSRLKQGVLDFNDVESVAVMRDFHCAFAGDRTFTNNLTGFTGGIFAIKGRQAYGPYMDDTLNLFTGASSLLVQSNTDYGHVDAYMSSNHNTLLDQPILNWLNSIF